MNIRVNVYPSDRDGCGMFRLGWPSIELAKSGSDVTVQYPEKRWDIGAKLDAADQVVDVVVPDEIDVIVIQRTTHDHLIGCIPHWQARGIAVVVDLDDDLACVSRSNPAYAGMIPGRGVHSWANQGRAAALADVVTTSTPALAQRYGSRSKPAVLLSNYLPEHYYGRPRLDNSSVGWPADIRTHPEDAVPLGAVLAVLQQEGTHIRLLGNKTDPRAVERYRKSFALSEDPDLEPLVRIEEWPDLVGSLGIGLAPLADTRFNAAKSWLKVLEFSALGVPWVASDRADYRRFQEQTGVGILARRPMDWDRALRNLIASPAAREEASEAGRAAAEDFRIRDHAWRWAEAWELAVTRRRAAGKLKIAERSTKVVYTPLNGRQKPARAGRVEHSTESSAAAGAQLLLAASKGK